jgi:hypothetical protein
MYKHFFMPLLKILLLPVLMVFMQQSVTIDQPPVTVNSSKQELFKYIRCHRQGKNIVINWGVSSISNVHHYEVYHSELGDFYDRLQDVYANGSLKSTFIQNAVLPGYHYYYIKAVMNVGAPVDSPVDIVRIVGH